MAATVTKIPGQYAKFITVALGQVLVYLQTFGWAWQIKPAATMAAVALAVLAVPNAAAPVPPVVTPAAPAEPLPPTGSQT